jgi:hypothetical protein
MRDELRDKLKLKKIRTNLPYHAQLSTKFGTNEPETVKDGTEEG